MLARFFPRFAQAVPFLLVLGAAGSGCDSEKEAAPGVGADAGPTCPVGTTGETGTVNTTISGLPAGASADVRLGGSTAPITTSGSTSLSTGPYTVMVQAISIADPVARTTYLGAGATSICVTKGATVALDVTYSLVASSHRLYATHGNGIGQLASVDASSLTATTGATATTYDLGLPNASSLAFDRAGNAWIASGGGGEISRTPAAALGAGGTLTPDLRLSSDELKSGVPGPVALAFDATGDLFVGLAAQKKIVRIAQGDYLAGSATLSLSLSGDFLDGISALAFDKSGNLFATVSGGVLRYDRARLATSSGAKPDLTLVGQTPEPTVTPLTTPSGLAFDAAGNLWVAYFAANTIARYAASETLATGEMTSTPGIQLTTAVTSILEEIAFDESGGLFLTYTAGRLARLSPAQLAASGTVTPDAIFTLAGLGSGKALAFFPSPSFSPLYAATPSH